VKNKTQNYFQSYSDSKFPVILSQKADQKPVKILNLCFINKNQEFISAIY